MYKTFDQIVSEMQADMISAGSTANDFTDGSQLQTMIAVAARGFRNQWYMLEQLLELFFASTTDGPFLDLRFGERGIPRKQGTKSSGEITFTRSTPAPVGSLVPAGTTFSTLDGSVVVSVTADVNLPAQWTTATALVQCTTVGVAGNLPASTPLQIAGAAVIGLQAIAVGPGNLSGGVDTESDDQYRARYLEILQNPIDGGTPADYLIWAKAVQGIVNASVFPLARGNGTVDIVVTDGGIPSQDLVQQVQSVINTNRPVGADAQVLAPNDHVVNVTLSVALGAGYSLATVQPVVSQALQNYLATVPIGGVVRLMPMADAVFKGVAGVVDCQITAPAANIQLATEELATLGTVTVNQMS